MRGAGGEAIDRGERHTHKLGLGVRDVVSRLWVRAAADPSCIGIQDFLRRGPSSCQRSGGAARSCAGAAAGSNEHRLPTSQRVYWGQVRAGMHVKVRTERCAARWRRSSGAWHAHGRRHGSGGGGGCAGAVVYLGADSKEARACEKSGVTGRVCRCLLGGCFTCGWVMSVCQHFSGAGHWAAAGLRGAARRWRTALRATAATAALRPSAPSTPMGAGSKLNCSVSPVRQSGASCNFVGRRQGGWVGGWVGFFADSCVRAGPLHIHLI